jgi:DNA-binding transcriptional ArsR family regulator
MRAAIWLYLVLLSRLPASEDTAEIDLAALAQSMGLPDTTVGSWLGHLKKARYVSVERRGTSVRVRVKHLQLEPAAERKARHKFTVAMVEQALGETGSRERLTEELARHPPDVIAYALSRATDVPRSKIRRSRTALFIYLLNHDDKD